MVYEPKPLQSSVMMLFFHFKIFVTMQKIDLNKHFSSGGIQEIEAHEGPYASCFQHLGALATIWFANFVTAYIN